MRMVALTASFKWTSEEGHRLRRGWLRFTVNGRTHRRNAWFMCACGMACLAFGISQFASLGPEFGGVAFRVASAALPEHGRWPAMRA
jgi:hypothetical protein